MNNNPHYDTTRLNAIPISRVAEFLGMDLKSHGSKQWTQCLWHDDHKPSLMLNETNDRNNCHCFVCGESHSVIDLVMQHQGIDFKKACEMLSDRFGIQTMNKGKQRLQVRKRVYPSPEQKPMAYIPVECMEETLSHENSLCRCLYQLYPAPLVDFIADEYRLGRYEGRDLRGGSIEGGTIFWLIDEEGRVHNGKMQLYYDDINSPLFGHYDHGEGRMQYIGWQYERGGKLEGDGQLDTKCLFGAHLLKGSPGATVVLVESPKNAIVGACEHPEFIWVAAGSKSMLNTNVLKPLANRQVIVIPDRDAIPEWSERIDNMYTLANFHVSDFCERMAPTDQPKYDIADYIIEQRMKNVPL